MSALSRASLPPAYKTNPSPPDNSPYYGRKEIGCRVVGGALLSFLLDAIRFVLGGIPIPPVCCVGLEVSCRVPEDFPVVPTDWDSFCTRGKDLYNVWKGQISPSG